MKISAEAATANQKLINEMQKRWKEYGVNQPEENKTARLIAEVAVLTEMVRVLSDVKQEQRSDSEHTGEPVACANCEQLTSALARAIWDRQDVEALLFKLTGTKWSPKVNTPQQRTWVGLTELEAVEFVKIMERGNFLVAIYDIEKKLKEKNT